jgi:demethylmenaquinone methyltransferase/2-methoxy-6-polyprenyl-1,4-benzoquinol methylase
MPALVLMKAFENAPARYDGAMQMLTLGRLGRLRHEIAGRVQGDGRRVLDVGCGTGSLAVMMAKTGARVLGIDTSEAMLDMARQRVAGEALGERVELRRLSAMEIDKLPRAAYDFVVSTLVLSELSEDEAVCVLTEARERLAPGGRLLIADETVPASPVRRFAYAVLRFPLRLVTYLITQAQSLSPRRRAMTALYFAIELPLMLLVFLFVPPTSRPLENLETWLGTAGFRITAVRHYLGGSLKLVEAGVA